MLSQEKIAAIIKEAEKAKSVTVTKLEQYPGSEAGDNYSCVVTAVNAEAEVDGIKREFHYMLKLPPQDPGRVAMIRNMYVEEKEIAMYKEVIPAFQKLIKDAKADFELGFAPYQYSELEVDQDDKIKNSILVMDNMCTKGYRDAVNKKKGLNIHYTKLALEELAKYHALGYAYIRRNHKDTEGYRRDNPILAKDYFMAEMKPEMGPLMDNFVNNSLMPNTAVLLEACQEPGQDFVGVIDRLHKKDGLLKVRDDLLQYNKNNFNTMCHGDAWFNNMLFKYVGMYSFEYSCVMILIQGMKQMTMEIRFQPSAA